MLSPALLSQRPSLLASLKPAIISLIFSLAPAACSCNDGYGSALCSVDVTLPPTVLHPHPLIPPFLPLPLPLISLSLNYLLFTNFLSLFQPPALVTMLRLHLGYGPSSPLNLPSFPSAHILLTQTRSFSQPRALATTATVPHSAPWTSLSRQKSSSSRIEDFATSPQATAAPSTCTATASSTRTTSPATLRRSR